MAKGVYRRYRGSRQRVNTPVLVLVILIALAAAFLIYVKYNLEDGGDGTTLLALPFSDKKLTFGEPQVELVVDEPVDIVVDVVVPEYEKRVEKPVIITYDKNFAENVKALTDVNTVVVKYKYDSGEVIEETVAKDALSKVKAAGYKASAMISCFKDKAKAKENPALATLTAGGELWTGADGFPWLNPYNEEACDYLCTVIEGAYNAGFREVLLTNLSFPADESATYTEGMDKGAAISAFLDKLVALSVDKGDLRIAIYFDGKDSNLTGQELDGIIDRFYRIYTRDADIYNKVGTLIPEDKLPRRIVTLQ